MTSVIAWAVVSVFAGAALIWIASRDNAKPRHKRNESGIPERRER